MLSDYPLIQIHDDLESLCGWLEEAIEPEATPEAADDAIEAAQAWLFSLTEHLREFAYPDAEHRVEVAPTQAAGDDDEFAGVNAYHDPGSPYAPGLALLKEFDRLAAPFRSNHPARHLDAPLPADAAERIAELKTLVESRLSSELETERRQYDEDSDRWGDGPNAY